MSIRLFLFFILIAARQTISNLSTALSSNVKSTILPKLTVTSGLNSTVTSRAKEESTESYEPPMLIIGNSVPGRIDICPLNDPQRCFKLTEEENVSINAIALAGEHIYAGLESGVIWRCLMREKDSCVEIIKANSAIKSIAVAYEFIYAGLEEGIMRRCRVNKEDSCVEFRKEGASVNAIAVQNYDYVYAGFGSQIMECVQRRWKDALSCKPYYDAEVTITALTTFGDEFLFLGLQSGALLRYPLNNYMDSCLEIDKTDSGIYSLFFFSGLLYAGLSSGAMLRCHVNEKGNCERTSTKKQGKYSFVIAYSTVSLYKGVKGEHERCPLQNTGLRCPPLVTYYDYKQRIGFELNVKHGLIFHSNGEPFDTLEGLSYKGYRAIFVMEPSGRIYASSYYAPSLLHHSSLVGGHPVSAAGEIVVDRGVIKSVIYISGHYKQTPDVHNQILDSLWIKGYKKAIEVKTCDKLSSNTSLILRTSTQPAASGVPIFCNNDIIDTGSRVRSDDVI